MLPKNLKLKKFDFEQFFKIGEKLRNEYFLLIKIKSHEKKFSVIPSSKEFKKAVERNRVKRRIYEIIRLNIDKIPKGLYLILPNKKTLNISFEELAKNILELLINKKSTNYSQ